MHTLIRTLLVAGFLFEPAISVGQAPERDIPRTSGKVLVLDNECLIEGDIVREGDRYRIHRNAGETWVPVEKVRLVCDSLDEVYRNMRGRANLRDIDELLKLARWCMQHGLRDQAGKEVQAILALRPQHPEAQRLWKTLQKPAPQGPAITPVSAQEAETTLPISLGVTLEAQGQFSSRIQMILMNTCASCHATGRGGAFKLVRAYNDGSTNRRATQLNIAAVMGQINAEDWQLSPLLAKAVSIHWIGESSNPPLRTRQHPAYRLLEEWVQVVVADMPRKPQLAAAAKTSADAPALLSERTLFAATPLPASQTSRDSAKPEAPATPAVKTVEPPAKEATSQPVGPVDPFDPSQFNQPSGHAPG